MLVFACISPHPPIILPAVGSPTDRAKVKKTIQALESLAPKLAQAKPDCLIITSPHPDWGINVPAHFLLAQVQSLKFKVQNYQEADSLTLSPNPYFGNSQNTSRQTKYTLYPILTTLDSPRQHFEWGKKIGQGLPLSRRIGWIASGDMSHRLREDGPYGFHPSGPKFDKKFIELLKKKDVSGILDLDPNLIEEAAECGLRSFCMLLGALEATKVDWQPEILSYEGPFGVGYLVAEFKLS